MRRILLGLAAIDVDHLELRDAIELAARRATDAGGVDLDISIGDVNGLDEPVRSLIYRISSELVSNAVRHGHPSQVRLDIQVEGELVRLDLHDDGIGFPVPVRSMADIPEREGLGLRTLARLHQDGSISCEVHSSPGAGVQYHVTASVGLIEDDGDHLRPDDLAVR
jgi:signal transduction histidine kinase